MKKKIIIVLVMMLAFTSIFANQPTPVYASDTSNVTKMLSSFKRHHYKTAQKYANKIKSTYTDSSERKMTSSMKRAFKKIARTYNLSAFEGVYFVDMDGDNKAEMIIKDGTGMSLSGYVYKYRNGKAIYVGQFDCGHGSFVNYPGHRGLICHTCVQGYEYISTVCLRNGKISWTDYGQRNIGLGDYLNLKQLNDHLTSHYKLTGF